MQPLSRGLVVGIRWQAAPHFLLRGTARGQCFTPVIAMSAPDPHTFISASAVGEYVYCARAYGLRQVTADAADPAAAARAAQGQAPDWRPGAARWLAQRNHHRTAALAGGVRAHCGYHRRVRTTTWLVVAVVLLIMAAIATSLLPTFTP